MRPPAGIASLATGVEALRGNPLRTALATLGVVIGVASLVAVLALGDGMERFGREEVARSTGVQTVVVMPRTTREVDGLRLPSDDYRVFTRRDAEEAAALPGVAGVSLTSEATALLSLPGGGRRAATVQGVLATAVDFEHMDLARGRFFTVPEERRGTPLVVVSHELAARLASPRQAESLLDREVRAGGRRLRVVGILAPPRHGRDEAFAFVPFRLIGDVAVGGATPSAPLLFVRARSVEAVEAVRSEVENWLASGDPAWEQGVLVTTSEARIAQVRAGMLIFRAVMGAIAGISLLVGGIGIMNVLLASVAERTREIGIRKAVGARHRDVLTQFLAESVAIAGVGSAGGVLLGLGGAFGITALIRGVLDQPMYAAFSWTTLLFAVACAAAVGLLFGTYPALRAARLSPIDAIRHE